MNQTAIKEIFVEFHTVDVDEDTGNICVWRKGDIPADQNWFDSQMKAAEFLADVMITTGDDRLGFMKDTPTFFDKVKFVQMVKRCFDRKKSLH